MITMGIMMYKITFPQEPKKSIGSASGEGTCVGTCPDSVPTAIAKMNTAVSVRFRMAIVVCVFIFNPF